MTQRDLDRQVARATGETIDTIRSLGFSLVEIPEAEPRTVDWDAVDENRVVLFAKRGDRQLAAAA